ncbi:MAG: hypothetical protein AAF539_13460 [Planctomycetota bacterium]
MTHNPFAVTTQLQSRQSVFAEHAQLRRRSFLYRVIDVHRPFEATMVYSGWWFRQTVRLGGEIVWFQISWMTIRPRFEFRLPDAIQIEPGWSDIDDGDLRRVRFEIQFSRGLRIRRLQIWLSQRLLFDEIN